MHSFGRPSSATNRVLRRLLALLVITGLAVTLAAACNSLLDIDGIAFGPLPDGGTGPGGATGLGGEGGSGGLGGSAGAGGAGGAGVGGALSTTYRQRITVTADVPGAPEGYSVRLTIDHATLVAAGKSHADGNDVRIERNDGSPALPLHRVLGLESSWNSATTVLWFATQAAIAADQSDDGYFLVYGAGAPSAALADPDQVFLFFDDFESGGPFRWDDHGSSVWSHSSAQARSGTRALSAGTTVQTSHWITADGVDEANVAVDSYWLISDLDTVDMAVGVRSGALPLIDEYEINLDQYGAQAWILSKMIGGDWTGLATVAGNPPAATWIRVTALIFGTQMRGLVDGVQVVPAVDSTHVGGELSSGSVGLRVWNLPAGQTWFIDDFRARLYVGPEPAVATSPEEVVP